MGVPSRTLLLLIVLTVAGLAACEDPASDAGPDAGFVDAAPLDATPADRGVQDAAPDSGADSGPSDSGILDADPADADPADADQADADPTDVDPADVDPTDADPPDTGAPDTGLRDDAGCPFPSGAIDDPTAVGLPSGVVLWLRGERGVATLPDGISVCRWEDVSGNGRHFLPATATLPSYQAAAVGGRPAVVFVTNSRLERPDVLGLGATQGRAIAVRSQIVDTTRRFGSLLQGNRGNNWEYLELEQNTFNTVGSRVGVYLTANAYDSDVATSTAARTHVYSITTMVTGTTLPGALSYAVDGVERTLTRTPGGNGPSGPGNNLVWDFSGANFTSIGETATPGFTGGAIGEVLVFDHPLTPQERAAVEAHLGR
ncbi:MAG: hypothetical protein IPG45_25800 [Deltaproteobacteria bacterium]|nr:hypothetical protein [Deltaproteobacteria bacterium]